MADDKVINFPVPLFAKESKLPDAPAPPELDTPEDVKRGDSVEKVMDQDLVVANNAIRAIQFCFGRAESIVSICRLVDTSMNVLEKRRKLMGLSYGAEGKAVSNSTWEPIP